MSHFTPNPLGNLRHSILVCGGDKNKNVEKMLIYIETVSTDWRS